MFVVLEWPSLSWTPLSFLLSVFAIAVFSIAVSFIFVLGRAYSQVRNFDGPPCHLIKGHLEQATFDGQGLRFHQKCTELYKTAYRVWFGPLKSAVVLCHPDAVKPLLATTFKDRTVSRLLAAFLGVGLGLQEGERWKNSRRLLTPAFHFETIQPYIKIFQESADILLSKWASSPSREVELFHDIGLLTFDSILKCAFSYWSDCQVKRPDSFLRAVHENTQAIMDRFRTPLHHSDFVYNLTSAGRRFKKNSEIVGCKADEIIKKRRKALVERPEEEALRRQEHFDFLDILLEARRDDGQGLTDEEIRAEVRTFMFAGLDTVTSAISWILYCLALHPEHQQKCREEIDLLFENGNDLQRADLCNVPYLKLCINESMRLYSPVPIICRLSDKEYEIQGRTLPSGTFLYVNIFAIHRNPYIWKNPEVFDPLRFTEENTKKRPSHTFIPFSSGRRNCIGKNFAMAEIKSTIAMILHRFELTVSEDNMVSMEDLLTVLVLRSKKGLKVNVTPRDHNHNSPTVCSERANIKC